MYGLTKKIFIWNRFLIFNLVNRDCTVFCKSILCCYKPSCLPQMNNQVWLILLQEREQNSDLDDLTLECRLAMMRAARRRCRLHRKQKSKEAQCDASTNKCDRTSLYKRRLRDSSPASSVERLRDEVSVSGDEGSRRSRRAPRWRKKYLIAGLFSSYYKEEE